MFKSIQLYESTDLYINGNDVEKLGFDKNKTFGEILDIAIANKCQIIIKNGSGKWYLKGQGKDSNVVKSKIIEQQGKYPRAKAWLINYDESNTVECQTLQDKLDEQIKQNETLCKRLFDMKN